MDGFLFFANELRRKVFYKLGELYGSASMSLEDSHMLTACSTQGGVTLHALELLFLGTTLQTENMQINIDD